MDAETVGFWPTERTLMDAEFIYSSVEHQALVDAEIERWAETLALLSVND